MNIFAISGFINGINQTFGLLTLAVAIWSFSYGFWQMASDKFIPLFSGSFLVK